ncbi:hypothetical protein GXW83_13305 [Streptacidiphilus sp. PB12-B1b]|uniref:condensation domain-containing protein n=1 Tax=Streptacidiphilus sp. PB12-B1b TaxID=2705012 RepID=UPI0015FD4339|nr:condensation domain-containing protein [Streptacidiphilus sp. PB12-B1b]QMU76574.1 hypothetical protein GXW83_13305 [Streptacidiphilus sp. PB12-B1b]
MTRTRITIRYDGGTSGTGPLTFGQDNMIRCIRQDQPDQINKQGTWPVPDTADLPAALAALRTLAERHQTLRTVFPAAPDDPGGFPVRQEVRAEGEFTVEAIETDLTDDLELDLLADELGRASNALPFDLAVDFPLRCTLLTRRGQLLRLIVAVCHAAADGAATALLVQEWALLAAGKELPPVSSRTPLQVAEAERTRQGLRRARTSLRHWERILRTGPHAVFADSRLTGPPSPVSVLIARSRTGAEALDAASRRTGATPSTVLLAAFAALAAYRAAQPGLVIAALSANRHRPGLADHVGTIAQDGLLSLDAGAADLDELIGRTKAASMAGFLNSTFDAEKIWQMIEDTAHLRGARFARHIVVNDLSLTIPDEVFEARPAPTADPEISWFPDEPVPARLMFNILRVPGRLEFALLSCPQVLDRAEAEEFVRGLLAIVRQAAHGPVPLAGLGGLTRLSPGVRAGDWQQHDNSWIDLDAVRALLAGALGGVTGGSRVRIEGGRLVARIAYHAAAGAGEDPELIPQRVHRAVMAALPQHETAMAPQHYLIHGRADPGGRPPGPPEPSEPSDDWERLPVLAEGSGRDPGVPDWQALLA